MVEKGGGRKLLVVERGGCGVECRWSWGFRSKQAELAHLLSKIDQMFYVLRLNSYSVLSVRRAVRFRPISYRRWSMKKPIFVEHSLLRCVLSNLWMLL